MIRFASAQDRPLSEAWLSLQGTTQPLDGYALDEVSLKVKYEEVDSLLARVQPVSPSLVLRQASQQADEARTALEQLLRKLGASAHASLAAMMRKSMNRRRTLSGVFGRHSLLCQTPKMILFKE